MAVPLDPADPLDPQIRSLFTALDHGSRLPPAGDLPAARVLKGEAGREALGTRVQFTLGVVDARVQSVRYQAYGCPHTLATCEWLARELEGRRPPLAGLADFLGGPLGWSECLRVPAQKLGRLLVIEDALRNTLAGQTK